MTINLDKTIPALTVASPADQTVESSSTVTVSGTLTDALSGISGVTCDGVTATLSGGGFSCNISLTVGVNLVVVRGTDIAGNVAGDNFHLSLTGALPAPASLTVTPTGVNLVVGGTQQFTVVDDQGRPRPDATWGVDNTSIATIDANSSPTLTAVATGTATLTATVGSATAQTQVNVLSGTSLPVGTVLWSAPTPSGYVAAQTLQAVPVLGSPDLYSVQVNGGGQAGVSALTADGQQVWNSAPPSGSFHGVSDGNGGLLMLLYPGYPGPSSIVDLDGQTGATVWRYTSTGTISRAFLRSGYSDFMHLAVGPDGRVYFEESGTSGLSLVALDGTTGAVKARYPVPYGTDTITSDGSCQQTGAPETLVDHAVQLTDPVVGPDGTVLAGQSVLSTTITYGCTVQVSDDQKLSLLKMAPDGSTSTILVYDDATHHTQNPGSSINEVIPDPFGGALVSWEYDYPPPGSQQSFHITDVGSSGLSDFTVPFAAIGMVLGDNNAVFMAGGNQALAYQLPGGSSLWAYTSAGGQLSPLVATNGGGLAIDDSHLGVIQLDSTGSASVPGTTVPGLPLPSPLALGNWLGNMNGQFAEFVGPFINLAPSSYPFAAGDIEGQNASKFDFELVWCANGNCSSPNLNLMSQQLQDVNYSINPVDNTNNMITLTAAQIKTIQLNALNALNAFRIAFNPYKVDVGTGRLASNTVYVTGLSLQACAGTNPIQESWSGVIYPTNMREAQYAVNDTAGTPTRTLLGAIGEGLGNNAAHEIGWQMVNRYSTTTKIVNGLNMDDNSTDTYNGIDCFGTSSPWVYTGASNGVSIHWSNDAIQSLTNILGTRN